MSCAISPYIPFELRRGAHWRNCLPWQGECRSTPRIPRTTTCTLNRSLCR